MSSPCRISDEGVRLDLIRREPRQRYVLHVAGPAPVPRPAIRAMDSSSPTPPTDASKSGRPKVAARSTGNLTLDDVSKLAGVSPITVSRALNHPELVASETLAAIRRVVTETGYVPNLLAGGLASNRSRLVAAIIPTLGNAMFIDTMQPLNDMLAQQDYRLVLGLSGFPRADEDELLKGMLSRRPDALVLTGVRHSSSTRLRLRAARIPIVEIWDLTPEPLDLVVGFSHVRVGGAAALHLYGKGYRRFASVCAHDERARVRHAAFVNTLGEHGINLESMHEVQTPTTVRMGRESFARVFNEGSRPEVIFCSSDVLAHGLLAEAQSRGLKVPDDVAVMGFADLDFAAYTFPALTTVHVDRGAIGRMAGEMLLARLDGKIIESPVVDVGFHIVDRASA